MSTFNGIPALALTGSISTTPTNFGSTLPWNGTNKFYQWSTTLAITQQKTSGVNTRQKLQYNGLDVNVGQWIVNASSGLTWQIVSITSKSTSSVSCVVQDIFRYNTYRDPTQTGNGRPATGSYVIFDLSDEGQPVVDPAPSSVGTTFLSSMFSRFQYINTQTDFIIFNNGAAGPLGSVYIQSPGTGYVAGQYTNVPLINANGTGATADIEVNAAGGIASILVTGRGSSYIVTTPYTADANSITVSNTFLGNSGSGFSGGVLSNFMYGDVIAVDATAGFQLASATYLNIIGTVTATDDSGLYFTFNAIQKINDTLNALPGSVGNLIYSDPNNPGGLTTTPGGTEVFLQLRTQTQSNTQSSTFGSPTTPITTVGNTFNVNGYLATVGGTGSLNDVSNAINLLTEFTGVTATLAGAYNLNITAVDARAINFLDVSGSTVEDAGLVSVENGVKAAGMYITNGRTSASFSSVIGYTFTQGIASTTWTINHNANTANYMAQIFDTTHTVIFPDSISTVDVNNVQVTFADAQAGTAQLSLFVPEPA